MSAGIDCNAPGFATAVATTSSALEKSFASISTAPSTGGSGGTG